jgi:hypothetical protein
VKKRYTYLASPPESNKERKKEKKKVGGTYLIE